MNKKQLITIKKLLCTYYKQTPKKLRTSIATIGVIDVSTIISACYYLFENNQDLEAIGKSLLASGVTTGIIIELISYQISSINKAHENKKNKVLKK